VGRAPLSLSPEAEHVLMRYRWPGNIRELQNVMRSVALFCEGDVIQVEHLAEFPELFAGDARGESVAVVSPPRPPEPRPEPVVRPPPPIVVREPVRPGDEAFHSARDSLHRDDTEGLALGDLKRRLEFEAIANAMRQTGGNITRAAALLKMKRPRLSQIVNGNPELKAIKEASRGSETADVDD
jgi:DNA-binding NtrC family response regulator